jgi:hypothetical protein
MFGIRLLAAGALALGVLAGAHVASAQPAPDEQAAYERARPVFEKYCVGCHKPYDGMVDRRGIEHIDMSTYPFGGHHAAEAGAAIREALGAAGEPATMPMNSPGSVQGEDLALILAWADAFDAAHPAPAGADHDDDDHDHDMGGMSMDHDMGGMSMDMHGMHDMHEMPAMLQPLGLPMSRDGSGTAWQPDSTPMHAHHWMIGGWMLMLHYSLHAGFDEQTSDRGDDKGFLLGWVMGMASHEVGGGQLTVRAMLSPEPFALGKTGYPLLLQSGEEVGGVPLHDRQHPHDLFMELAAAYAHAITDGLAFQIYAAPSGEPALGPVAFPHRPYALYDMAAPIGHHWEDSTHISFGVLTAALYTRRLKLEGSWFNGREPDEFRYDIDLRMPDSYSGRLTYNPSPSWSAQVSYGYLASPEALEPGVSVQRATASATYAGAIGGHAVGATAVLGHNMPSIGPDTSASLLEGTFAVGGGVTVFGRGELLTKTGADLDLGAADADRTFGMGALSLGAVYELPAIRGVVVGLGARGTLNAVGSDLESVYGTSTPLGVLVYVEVHPSVMRM